MAAQILGGLWMPNNAGDDLTGFNNFKSQDERTFHYFNFSTRLDWNINDRWKAYARVSRMKTDQDADRLHGRRRPAEAAQHHRVEAQRLEHRRRHRLHVQPLDDAQRARLLLPGRGQARLPRHGVGEEGYANLWPNGWWQPYAEGRPLIYSPYLVVESTARDQFGVANFWYQQPKGYSVHARLNKYLTQHSLKAGTEIRWKRGEAARFYYTDLRFVAAGDGQPVDEPEHDHREPLGELPARRDGPRQLERAVQAAADRQHRDVRLLRPGRLQGHPEAHAQPRPALRVRGRPVGPGVPAAAAARPHRPDPGHGRDDRPEDPRRHPGDHGPVGGRQELHLQRRLLLHGGGQQEEDERLDRRVHAAHRPRVAARRQDRRPRRLRALRHPDRARQLGARHAGRDRPRRLQPDDERPPERQRRPGRPSSPTRSRRA